MATFSFGSAHTTTQLQQNGIPSKEDGADYYNGIADPTANIIAGNITVFKINPHPIYRGFVSNVEFISTTIPDNADNVVIVGYTNELI